MLSNIFHIHIHLIELYNLLLFSMEQAKQNIFKTLSKLTPNINMMIVSFLSQQDLLSLNDAFQKTHYSVTHLATLASVKCFLNSHLHSTDRSIYFSFYNNQSFMEIDTLQVDHICQNAASYKIYQQRFKLIIRYIKQQMKLINSWEEIGKQIYDSFRDPLLPLPRMKKSGRGMFGNSTLQFFLVDKHFNQEQPYYIQCFQHYKDYLEANSNGFKSQYIPTEAQRKIISQVLCSPEHINSSNYLQYLLKDNSLHNFVVFIFSLIDNQIMLIETHLGSFHDPVARLVQFALRYCIFRNIVLGLQEKISFLLKMYCEMCTRMGVISSEPELSLWRTGLTMWHETMKYHHQTFNTVYIYLIQKWTNQELMECVERELTDFANILISVKNKLQRRECEMQMAQSVFKNTQYVNTGIEACFLNNYSNFEQITRQYLQYLVDISIQEYSVHWCGHSQHLLDQPYTEFQQHILNHLKRHYLYLRDLVFRSNNPQNAQTVLKKLYLTEFNFLQKGFIKPTTLKKVQTLMNDLLIDNIHNISLSCDSNQQSLINHDFNSIDNLLCYSNAKNNISFDINKTEEQLRKLSISKNGCNIIMIAKSTETQDSIPKSMKPSKSYVEDMELQMVQNMEIE